MKKKVLVVSTSFTPMISARSFRTTELVKELCHQGHDVTLLTYLEPEHEELMAEWGFSIIPLGKRPKDFNLKNISGIEFLFKRVIRRILLYFFQFPEIKIMFHVKRSLKRLKDFDIMISVATPHPTHWGTALARKKSGDVAKIWLADCGDPFMMAKYDNLGKPFYLSFFEKLWGKRADFISIPRANMKSNYYTDFHHKILEITQGFKFPEAKTEAFVPNKVPTFAFAGTFMRVGRHPAPLLEYLNGLDTDFRFVVYTKRANLLEPFKEKLGEKLVINGLIPREELLIELGKMDFLINIGYDPIHQSPSKLIDYYITNRPVLSFNTSDILPDAINEFLKGNYKRKFVFDNMDRFRIENVVKKVLNPGSYINE